jgi:hypothetical protein
LPETIDCTDHGFAGINDFFLFSLPGKKNESNFLVCEKKRVCMDSGQLLSINSLTQNWKLYVVVTNGEPKANWQNARHK